MQGLGTDDPAIRAAIAELADKTPEEIAAIDQQYRALSDGQTLENGLWGDVGGHDWFNAQQALRGRPVGLSAEVDRLLEAVTFDRGADVGIDLGNIMSGVSNLVMDRFNAHGANLDRTVTRLRELRSAYFNGTATEGEVRAQMAMVRQDLGIFQDARESGSETFANALTTAVAVGIGIFSGGSATPVAILMYTAIGAATNTVTRVVLSGQTYDLGSLPTDLITGGVTTGTAPLTFMRIGTSPSFFGNIARGALEGGINGGALGFLQGGLSTAAREQTWEQGFQLGVMRVGEAGLANAVVGVPTGALIGGISRSLVVRRLTGGAQEPTTGPLAPNANGARTMEEAVALARQAGINIPDDITFVIDPGTITDPTATATYLQLTNVPASQRFTWPDFANRFGNVVVRVRAGVLASDENIISTFAHEMHELNNLRTIFSQRGSLSAAELFELIRVGRPGNLHCEAWDYADLMLTAFRNRSQP